MAQRTEDLDCGKKDNIFLYLYEACCSTSFSHLLPVFVACDCYQGSHSNGLLHCQNGPIHAISRETEGGY